MDGLEEESMDIDRKADGDSEFEVEDDGKKKKGAARRGA
jgi:hypothetical protein